MFPTLNPLYGMAHIPLSVAATTECGRRKTGFILAVDSTQSNHIPILILRLRIFARMLILQHTHTHMHMATRRHTTTTKNSNRQRRPQGAQNTTTTTYAHIVPYASEKADKCDRTARAFSSLPSVPENAVILKLRFCVWLVFHVYWYRLPMYNVENKTRYSSPIYV